MREAPTPGKNLVIKPGDQLRAWLACASLALAGETLRADGISISTSGLTWTKGVGGYGDGWGDTGTGIQVQKGDTVYLKFYSESGAGVRLHYAEHGRTWPFWRPVGPTTSTGIGDGEEKPIILKVSHIGTPHCVVSWINGPDRSGIWAAFNAPGPYDLGMSDRTLWTLPPLVVSDTPTRSFWSRLLGDPKTSTPLPATIHVPDGGLTAALLFATILVLAAIRRKPG